MINQRKLRRQINPALAASLLALVMHSSLSTAGSAQITGQDNTAMSYEYSGDSVRMNTSQGRDSYMLFLGDKMYMVSYSDGKPMVIDAAQGLGLARSLGGSQAMSSINNHRVLSIKPLGETEEHAGIKGEVYTIRVENADGKIEENEIVLTDDAKAMEFRDAMLGMSERIRELMGTPKSTSGDTMDVKLKSMNKGILRFGNDMTVTAISNDTIDPARFELPAQPVDMSALGGILGSLSRQAEQGAADENSNSDSASEQPANPLNELGKSLGNIFKR